MKEGDAGGLFHYFQLKQSEDPNFFYAVQVDRDDLIANVFWADAKMKADYAYFGDVVSFDTTYKKNKEGRPFAIFVGVNHHKQSIVFGAALLYDETADTFMWLFDTFQKAMDGKRPETILTDQDAAMAKALEEKWRDTRHRLCIWHIYQNAAVHLSSVFSRFNDFSKDFRSCIYDYEEEEDFIDAWHELLTKYDLKDNEWLKKMFKKKEKWALVYGRQTFCANMTSTQRSESMNSVLKKYVSNKNNLVQFFHNFGKLVDDRRYKEREADLRTNHSTPKLDVEVEILKHARTVYTHEVLKIFQYEFGKAIDSKLEIVYESEGPSQYKITPLGKRYHHTVTFDGMECKVSCSCRKFEFAGILCSHVLRVFTMKNITTIPELYIKKRWTKKAKKGIVDTFSQSPATSREPSKNTAEENEKIRTQNHYRELCRLFNHLTTRASPIEEGFEFARSQLIKTIEGVDMIWENKVNIKSVVEPLQNAVYTLEKNGNVSGEVTVKGWAMKENSRVKSGKRLKSGLEQTTGKRRPKQTKSSTNKSSSDATFENGGRSLNAKDGEVDYVALQTMPHPLIPLSSHIPQINKQNYGVHVQNSSHPQIGLPYAVRGHTFPYMQPSQMMELNTLNVHQQFNHWPQYVEQEQVISHSLTKLLQNQIFQGQDVGMFPLQDSAQENQHQNASKQDGNGHGV